MLRSAQDVQPVLRWMQTELGADKATCHKAVKLSGGAIQENWRLELQITGGRYDGEQHWVLRTDAPSAVAVSSSRVQEFTLLQAVCGQDVPVPQPICVCTDSSVLGRPFFLMTAVSGQAQGRKLVRDPKLKTTGPGLVAQLGEIMARIHKITPQDEHAQRYQLSGLPGYNDSAAVFQIAQMRTALDQLGSAHPVLEYGLNWLEDNLSEWEGTGETVLCHRDFRTGNFLVEDGLCTALLDWEFAGWSDRHEDIGWLCARCWRFGNTHLAVGGLGPFSAFRQAYERISGQLLNVTAIGFWQVMAEIRWAVIALQQAARNRSGQEMSLELALSGYLVPEMEVNMLTLIDEITTGNWQDLDS